MHSTLFHVYNQLHAEICRGWFTSHQQVNGQFKLPDFSTTFVFNTSVQWNGWTPILSAENKTEKRSYLISKIIWSYLLAKIIWS